MPDFLTRRAWAPALLLAAAVAHAQTTPPQGTVIFERHTNPAGEPLPPATAKTAPDPSQAAPETATPDISDTERGALTFTAYDLDVRLTPASSQIAARARLTVRNDGPAPLTHIALQISSALTWESVTLVDHATRRPLVLAQHRLETDADHTGNASEAILTLPDKLEPGKSLTLDAFYSGAIVQSANRLERIGAAHDQAAAADWDAITPDAAWLRGFGDVLWYPVAAPQVFLGQGAQLFDTIGQTRLRQADATVHLRLSVSYAGDPPAAAFFCGRRLSFTSAADTSEAPVADSAGLAIADFPAASLGARVMSLFVVPARETPAGGNDAPPLLQVEPGPEASAEASIPLLAATAKDAAALLRDWLGPQPLSSLYILDHPGQPFEDGPLLVAPLSGLAAADAGPALTHSLTHAWVQTQRPWIDEGLAQFFVLLSMERSRGREAATAQLSALLQPLTLAEPALEQGKPAPAGQPLLAATSELYFRRKAAAVWWMLRDLAGEDSLKLSLQAWRTRPASPATAEEDARAFELLLEKTSGKDLRWFFDDWVLHDRGLPDLTLVDVTPRELPAVPGKSTGWLVAVTVRNDGAAAADVPLIIRAGSFSTTQRIRIPGFASTSTRIVVEAPPTEVLLNDGSTPEQRTSIHTRDIVARTR